MKVSTHSPISKQKLQKRPPLSSNEAARPGRSTVEKRTLVMYEVKIHRIIYSFAALVFAVGTVICWILDFSR
jgi:hypothetical protein